MSTADLRRESRRDRSEAFTRAMDELQAAMIVIPIAAYYQPKFTYIWALGVGRFPDPLRKRVSRAGSAPRDRSLLSGGRGNDGPWRTGAGHRLVASGGRSRQPGTGERRLRRRCPPAGCITCCLAFPSRPTRRPNPGLAEPLPARRPNAEVGASVRHAGCKRPARESIAGLVHHWMVRSANTRRQRRPRCERFETR